MQKNYIFYGAGFYAKTNLDNFISLGMVPVCFADADVKKHYTWMTSKGGEYQILPLKEAMERYPDQALIITVMPPAVDHVRVDLIKNGVDPKRIFHHDTPKIHCSELGRYFVLDGLGVKTCCTPYTVNLQSTGNFLRDVDLYKAYCAQLREDLINGKKTSCDGCYMLEYVPVAEPEITIVNLSTGLPGGDVCNFKCTYCAYGESLGTCQREDNVLDIFRQMENIPSIRSVRYASGELTISPYREEILDIWLRNRWDGYVYSNGSVYNKSLARLSNHGVVVSVSLDSGTAETFKKVKQVDCFQKVLSNLEKYAQANSIIELKYILLDGVNTNETDATGFISLARKLNSQVCITRDTRLSAEPISDNEHATISSMIDQCRQVGLRYTTSVDYMT